MLWLWTKLQKKSVARTDSVYFSLAVAEQVLKRLNECVYELCYRNSLYCINCARKYPKVDCTECMNADFTSEHIVLDSVTPQNRFFVIFSVKRYLAGIPYTLENGFPSFG